MNHTVLTTRQAQQITGGRTPLIPLEYESAVKSLLACESLNEAKYWSDKADALAAWAKIYRNDDAGHAARRLKLHAFRRMGQIAAELRPGGNKSPQQDSSGKFISGAGSLKGAKSLLREQGLSDRKAVVARKLALKSDADFSKLIDSKYVPSIQKIKDLSDDASESWRVLSGTMCKFAQFTRTKKGTRLVSGLTDKELERVRRYATEIIEWMDEFDQALQKRLPAAR